MMSYKVGAMPATAGTALAALLISLSACSAGYHQLYFDSSSMDFNRGARPSLLLKNTEPKDAVARVRPIAEKLGLRVVFSACKGGRCEMSMKSESRTTSHVGGFGAEGWILFNSTSIGFSSLYYGRAFAVGDDTRFDLLGVPVMNDLVSCPPALKEVHRCKLEWLEIKGAKSIPEAVHLVYGVDVSGRVQAEVVSSILTELRSQ